jgi:murein DD-endopeptidase MepM/ murein hydrolase activator NlpD
MVRTRAALPVLMLVPLLGGSSPRALAAAPAGVLPLPPAQSLTYEAPVPEPYRVVRPFTAPRTSYGAGHRGVDLATVDGEVVHAAGPGLVTFAGTIAGRGLVVIAHHDGVRTEYEPVTPSVRSGATVAGGEAIGAVQGRHGTCAAGGCLHWGARRGDAYLDPLLLLRPLGVVRLVPSDDR